MSSNILDVVDVVQKFRSGFWMKETTVLHGVSLRVPERSIFGFLGANGAGKTTLIQLIVGLRKPTSGSVKLSGLDARLSRARSRVGYLPERPYFYEHLTGGDFLRYFGALSGLSRAQVASRIPAVLADVNMSEARDVELGRYSKGMLQRIGIAQAILHEPEFLVLDEPMSGLDPVGRKEMRELIQKMAAAGRTIFFSTHVIPDVEAICDQVALIQQGRMVGCGPIEGFLKDDEEKTEIVFSGVDEKKLKGKALFSAFRPISEGFRGTVEGKDKVQQVLREIIGLDGKVIWVNPIRPSLESRFEEAYLHRGTLPLGGSSVL
jgi:ABC-2 type transport system ATP-binding protein